MQMVEIVNNAEKFRVKANHKSQLVQRAASPRRTHPRHCRMNVGASGGCLKVVT